MKRSVKSYGHIRKERDHGHDGDIGPLLYGAPVHRVCRIIVTVPPDDIAVVYFTAPLSHQRFLSLKINISGLEILCAISDSTVVSQVD